MNSVSASSLDMCSQASMAFLTRANHSSGVWFFAIATGITSSTVLLGGNIQCQLTTATDLLISVRVEWYLLGQDLGMDYKASKRHCKILGNRNAIIKKSIHNLFKEEVKCGSVLRKNLWRGNFIWSPICLSELESEFKWYCRSPDGIKDAAPCLM